jgi:lysophospholipase L1-like esterase
MLNARLLHTAYKTSFSTMRYIRALAITLMIMCGYSEIVGAGPDPNAVPERLNCAPFSSLTNLPSPTPQVDPEAIQRVQDIDQQANAASHRVLFLGDSLMQKWDWSIWEQQFAPLGAMNAGVNGDRTENLLWRIEHGNIVHQHPELVVLLIGTNDIGRDRSARTIAEGIREILGTLRSRLPDARILLLGVLPRSESSDSHRRRQVTDVNQLIRRCADGKYVLYADVGEALLDRAGRLPREVSFDGVHLTQQGYMLLTHRLKVELSRMQFSR